MKGVESMNNPMNTFLRRDLVIPHRKELMWSALAWLLFLGSFSLILPLFGFHTDTPQGAYTFQFVDELLNFVTVLAIFYRFLYRSRCNLFHLVTTALLGYLALVGITYFWNLLLSFLPIEANNLNQAAVEASLDYEPISMAFYTIIMAPVIEELLVRAAIFGPLCKISPILAYAASMTVFSFLHIMGSIGYQPAAELLRSFLEYLPAGFMFGWAYQRTGSIYGPIALHAFSNAISIFAILSR